MKRWLMVFVVSLILVALIGSSALATLGRVLSLGNKDYFFKDIVHVYSNPAYLGMYTNYVYAELGSYDDWYYDGWSGNQILGVNYNIKNGFSLGLTLNRSSSPIVDVEYLWYEWGYYWGFEDGLYPMNEYDILASYDFDENLHFGIGFYHAGDKYEGTDTDVDTASGAIRATDDYEYSVGTNMLTGGFLYDFENGHSVEGWLSLRFDRVKFMENGTEYDTNWYDYTAEMDGGNGLMFGARGFFDVFEDFQVIPIFMFGTEKAAVNFDFSEYWYGYTDDTSGTSGDLKTTMFLVGLGGNLTLDKGMIAGGLHFYQEKEEDDVPTGSYYEDKWTYVPGFNLAVEYWLTNWLVARLGMEKQFIHVESKRDDKAGSIRYNWIEKWRWTSDPDDFITAGVGFKFSKFKVDATLCEETLFEGTYLMSGNERNLFGNLSVLFEF